MQILSDGKQILVPDCHTAPNFSFGASTGLAMRNGRSANSGYVEMMLGAHFQWGNWRKNGSLLREGFYLDGYPAILETDSQHMPMDNSIKDIVMGVEDYMQYLLIEVLYLWLNGIWMLSCCALIWIQPPDPS